MYALTWTAYASAGAIGPVIMGKAFDVSHSYQTLLSQLSLFTLLVGALMLLLPRYKAISGESAETFYPAVTSTPVLDS